MCLKKNTTINYLYEFYSLIMIQIILIYNMVTIRTTALTAASTVLSSFIAILMSTDAELYIKKFILMKTSNIDIAS